MPRCAPRHALPFAVLALCACAELEPYDDDPEAAALGMERAIAAPDAPPDGGTRRFTAQDFTHAGTGCPDGTASTTFDGVGALRTTYSALDVSIDAQTESASKVCVVGATLRSDTPVTYAVVAHGYSSYVLLDRGVDAAQSIGSGFNKRPGELPGSGFHVSGPLDRAVTRAAKGHTGIATHWVPLCASEQTFVAQVRASLFHAADAGSRGTGHLNPTDSDVTTSFTIEARPCTP